MKKAILLFGLTLLLFRAGAQHYQFTTLTTSYTDLANPKLLSGTNAWDVPEFYIPFGFTFNYFGVNLDSIYWDYGVFVNDNKYIGLVSEFEPYGAALSDRGFKGGGQTSASLSPIAYEVTGVLGARICKVEFKNMGFFYEWLPDSISSDYINFQVWFYEATNIIEIHFGSSLINNPAESYDGETGPAVVLVQEYDYTNNMPTKKLMSLMGSPASPTVLLDTVDEYLTGSIPSGTVYRFTPNTIGGYSSYKIHQLETYPNPVKNILNFNLPEPELPGTVEIYDLRGALVYKREVRSRQDTKLDIGFLKGGVYSVRATGSSSIYQAKVLREE